MDTVIVCSHCGARLKLKSATVGILREIRCAKCHKKIPINETAVEKPPTAAPMPQNAERGAIPSETKAVASPSGAPSILSPSPPNKAQTSSSRPVAEKDNAAHLTADLNKLSRQAEGNARDLSTIKLALRAYYEAELDAARKRVTELEKRVQALT